MDYEWFRLVILVCRDTQCRVRDLNSDSKKITEILTSVGLIW